ncbi:MAG: hypothetical protein ACRDFT_08145, partial [bacterium]
MIPVLAAVPAFALAASLAQNPAVDELRALARGAPESVLIERARKQPDDVGGALRELLVSAVAGDSAAVAALTAAERLAGAFTVAWRDSFLLRQVGRFRSLSPADRRGTIEADSVWRAGVRAFGQVGTDAAMLIWRESLRRFEALADTSGMARALGALGIAFHRAQEYD